MLSTRLSLTTTLAEKDLVGWAWASAGAEDGALDSYQSVTGHNTPVYINETPRL